MGCSGRSVCPQSTSWVAAGLSGGCAQELVSGTEAAPCSASRSGFEVVSPRLSRSQTDGQPTLWQKTEVTASPPPSQ